MANSREVSEAKLIHSSAILSLFYHFFVFSFNNLCSYIVLLQLKYIVLWELFTYYIHFKFPMLNFNHIVIILMTT